LIIHKYRKKLAFAVNLWHKNKKPMRDFTPIGLKVRQFKKGKE
jgi:hypothetical protein